MSLNKMKVKCFLLLIPFIALGASASSLTLVSQPATWICITALSSFVLSLFAIPAISRKSLGLGYLAITFILLVLAYTIIVDVQIEGPTGPIPRARVAKIFVNHSLNVPLACYRLAIGQYPTTEEGLDALIHCPKGLEKKWRGPYIVGDKIPLDPWGHPYQYLRPGVHNPMEYDLWSLGRDGKPSADDIGNW